ncbi:MAG: hypothetical protein EOP49_43850, partial [Sphingobacteriales bacterium]
MSFDIKDIGSARSSITFDVRADLITGMSDGLIIPFAIVTGMSSIHAERDTVLVTGIVAILIGAIAMGRGGYRAGLAAMSPRSKEGDSLPPADDEVQKTKAFLSNLGLNEEMQDKAVADIHKDREEWNEFIVKHDLRDSSYTPQQATRSGLTIALGYLIGGLIPVMPYFFLNSTHNALKIAAPLTIFFLGLLGFLKNKMLALNPLLGAMQMAFTGAAAAAAAFFAA